MTDRALTALDAFPATGNDAVAVKSFAPGFRFHPTDEELISYYLKRKVEGKPMRIDAIGEVNVYKHEPSDLPEHSRLKTKDQTWFFFCALEKKYSNGALINRVTNKGYWKHTGKDKKIKRGDGQLIGKIKKHVFYRGRVSEDQRTNWRIHEYHLVENDLELGSYVLCILFHKERVKPPSGYSYAPFLEEEWDDDDGTRASVPSVVHANRINEIQKETHSQSKNLFDLNELPREFDMDEDPKTVDQDDNNDEPPTRECLIFNKEAPLPLVQYKRKRQNDSFGSNHTIQTTQDHCSFPAKTVETISSVDAMLEENETEPVATMVSTSSSTELINDLDKERETFKLDMMCAELMINVLKGQNDAMRAEIKELKKNKRNKRQCS